MTPPVVGDSRILAELERIRRWKRNGIELPAFRRGRMIFDFKANRVRIAEVA